MYQFARTHAPPLSPVPAFQPWPAILAPASVDCKRQLYLTPPAIPLISFANVCLGPFLGFAVACR